MRQILHKLDASGRLLRWAIELSGFDIEYKPRKAIKAQTLYDFVVECTIPGKESSLVHDPNAFPKQGCWIAYVDRCLTIHSRGAGFTLTNLEGIHSVYTIKFNFFLTNNKSEYEALIALLRIASILHIHKLIIRSDSQILVNQVKGSYEAKENNLRLYLEKKHILLG